MATRLDRVSRPANRTDPAPRTRADRTREEELDLTGEGLLAPESSLLHSLSVGQQSLTAPPEAVTQAASTWLGMTFATAYVAIPALLSVVGAGAIGLGFWPQYPAFVVAAAIAAVGIAVARPTVSLGSVTRDPVLAASAGGFAVFLLVQNLLLTPLFLFPAAHVLGLLLINVVEMTMLGTMFASFTKRPGTAFALGAGFQLLVTWLSVLFLILL